MDSVLFVCLGNICRSPLAEGIAREIAQAHQLKLKIDSCGTGNWHIGEHPCENSIKVAKQHGIDISMLVSREITRKDLEEFSLIVALDSSNFYDLQKMGAKNLCKLGDFGFDGADVPDPYFFDGFEGFEKVYEMIEICVNNLFKIKFG
jgi:protein-tyrosine phosphatase